ncbi:adenylate/guanylate cyclase domain-containing protein [Marinifilum fragile]|uniref:adenylate/guanylate cyclase domain-containing protein n=1 Tax=Marinifilum fragile TaxID=570161 RepID=UPI0006D0AB02|nr:adenylate/guanylate cyclase domain-containing protein [Marinifilum fragile]
MNRTDRNKVMFLISFWILAAVFIIIYEWSVLRFEGVPYDLPKVLSIGLLITLLSAGLIAFLEIKYLSRMFRKRSFLYTLLVKSSFYLFNIIIFNSLVIMLVAAFKQEGLKLDRQVWMHYTNYVVSWRMFTGILFWAGNVFFALFVVGVAEKFGQGVLVNFLLGKYHRPREESRLFLIMDLNSSTIYAEKLGHIKYSEMIQDCFYDLTKVIANTEAQIYQYVGDEVVLTWKQNADINYKDCLNVFFRYQTMMKTKSAYYTKRYGMIPKFKAGSELGMVTVAEVGEIKKELAYHGNPINTASRLCKRCNEFDTSILVSENVMNELKKQNGLSNYKPIAQLKLKGKMRPLIVYSINDYIQNL